MNSTIPTTLLSPENTLCNLEVSSKKVLLEIISQHISKEVHSDSWETIFDALIAREKYGSTGFGEGIAIPHCRLAHCQQATAFFTKLSTAIDFDSNDGQAVDLVFALVVPEQAHDEHLDILSKIAQILENNAFRVALRDSNDDRQLFKRISKMLNNQSV